jgi:hypothetical protein
MEWYKTLTLTQRINLKANVHLIIGFNWELLISLFTFSEAIEIVYNKLKLEGFKV